LLRTTLALLVVLSAGLIAACGGGTPITSGTPTPPPTPPPLVTAQYPIPTKSARPKGIALGSDGNLWITEFRPSKLGMLNSAGKINENVTPTRDAGPTGIASGPGPNLNLWFTERNVARIGEITTAGPPYVEYTMPDPAARPVGIALGLDGNMWVTDPGTNSVWRVQPLRHKPFIKFTQFHLQANAQPLTITSGPDGALWFTEPGTNSIGRIPVSGSPVSEYAVTTKDSQPTGICSASDNALWFTELKARQIARMSVTGVITAEYPIPKSTTPNQILQGIDGNFYFTDTDANKMGQFFIKTHHAAYYSIPTANSKPTAMTLGLDNEIYFVETAGNKIGQFRYFAV
jgi:virginiamycin B lyase